MKNDQVYILQAVEYGIEVFKVIFPLGKGQYRMVSRLSENGAKRVVAKKYPEVDVSEVKVQKLRT